MNDDTPDQKHRPDHDPPAGSNRGEQSRMPPDPTPSDGSERSSSEPPSAEKSSKRRSTKRSRKPTVTKENRSKPMRPQRIPPLPRSKFTRYLIDYVGDGQYQLSAQGRGEGIVPMAKADSPAPLMMIASQTSEPGDELIIAPAVALIDVACMKTSAIQLLQSKGCDPFARIGNALAKRGKDEASDAARELEEAAASGDVDGSPEALAADEDSEPSDERLNGVDPAELPEPLRQMLERDRKTGGRLGWIFRIERGHGEDGGGSSGGDGDSKPNDPDQN